MNSSSFSSFAVLRVSPLLGQGLDDDAGSTVLDGSLLISMDDGVVGRYLMS